jgi:hypothetical protein
MFKRKKKITNIFDDLPVAPEVESKTQVVKKSGRRAMLIPDAPYDSNPPADLLLANTAKQRESWLEIIYSSDLREAKQLAIASYLMDNYRVQKWWANSIALMYLEWRAGAKTVSDTSILRLVYELPVSSSNAFTLLNGTAIYGADFRRTLKSLPGEKLVLTFNDETRATLIIEPKDSACEIIVEHEFIKDLATRKSRTKYWNELFSKLAEQVTR